jgi:hypothetical protein
MTKDSQLGADLIAMDQQLQNQFSSEEIGKEMALLEQLRLEPGAVYCDWCSFRHPIYGACPLSTTNCKECQP